MCTSSSALPQKGESETQSMLHKNFEYVINKLRANDSHKKRLKFMQKSPTYAQPQQIPIGIKWNVKIDPKMGVPDNTIVQTTYSYVSVIDSLVAKFSNPDFFSLYLDYNENSSHECKDGVYTDFCCGQLRNNYPIFDDKSTMKLQIGLDEFEPCNALKTKAGLHKQYAIYFEIRNVPEFIRSKLHNIHVIAMVPSLDLKQNDALDDVIKKIVGELKILETDGINVNSKNIKAGLINVSGDNLGVNGVLGFVESFAATYFCRMCTCAKDETQCGLREDSTKIRTESDYLNLLQKADRSKETYVDSKGLKKYCFFNDLKTFSLFENFSVDLMHDMNEGVIRFFIHIFIDYLIDEKIANLSTVQKLVRDFVYGNIWAKYKPSLLNVDKSTLNQNAMQIYCLMIHMPFIFNEYKSEVDEKMWNAMTDLLQMMQIIYSSKIRECDLKRLEKLIESHYEFIVKEMGMNLLPKHHFILHYPRIIKQCGPVIHAWMMRFESKHKVFTNIANRANNFKNLCKTFVNEHQMQICAQQKSYDEHILSSKTSYDVTKSPNYKNYSRFLSRFVENDNLLAFEFLLSESFQYRPGYFVFHEKKLLEIVHILKKDNEYFIFCACHSKKFNRTLNSVEIKPENIYDVISVKQLLFKRLYEKRIIEKDKMCIIADTLDVFNEF